MKAIRRWLPTEDEDDGERDGFLSTRAEWHAFVIGLYRGLTRPDPRVDDYAAVAERYDDAGAEPWYYKGGYVLGTLAQAAVAAVALVSFV